MRGRSSQNIWVLILLLLAGVVLGGFIANMLGGIPALSWLAYGSDFGFSSGLTIRFTIAGIIGIVLAFLIYRKL